VLATLCLLLALALSFAAKPASAAFLHTEAAYSFGSDGTSATELPGVYALDFNQPNNRLYALTTFSPRTIHGFNFVSSGNFTPVGGGFPLEVGGGAGDPGIAVDSTALGTAGNVYYAPDNSPVAGYSPAGNALAGFPLEESGGEVCGIAVDNQGKLWLGNYSNRAIERFNPTGGAATASVDVSAQGSPCKVYVDRATNDLYVSFYAPEEFSKSLWRYTAASGYDPAQAVAFEPGSTNVKLTVNAAKGILYAATGSSVIAYSAATGEKLEEFGGCNSGIAVDDTTDIVFLSNPCTSQIEEWKGVIIPDVTTGEPVGDKKISGSVDPAGGGEVTDCFFEYGESAGASIVYTDEVDCEPSTSFTTTTAVTADIPTLEGEKTYNYRLVATNANGTSKGANRTITPHNVQNLKTQPATNITRTSATLNGSFDGTNEETHYYFKWGLDENYGNETAIPPGDSAGVTNTPTTVSSTISGLTAGTTYHYRVVAENDVGISEGEDRTFTTAPAIKDLTTEAATDVTPTTAVLHGSLDPDNLVTTYYFEWGKTDTYGQATPLPPGDPVGTTAPGTAQVSTQLEDLEAGTTYHYRLVATNITGTSFDGDLTFTTPQAPSINSFSATNVTATTADLIATVNPNGADTTYYFEYGPTIEYGSTAPVPPGVLSASNTTQSITVPISGLSGVTYHFRLTVESEWGTVTTEDQSFDFNAPSSCPNHTVRQQTGAGYLPDCRAYEIVSAERAGGAALFAEGPTSAYASSPGRFAYGAFLNAIPGAGEPVNGSLFQGDLYVASRTATGWKTRYVGMPGYQSLAYGGARGGEYGQPGSLETVLTDRTMNHFLIWDGRQAGLAGGTLAGTYAPFVFDNEGNIVDQLPTGIEGIAGGETDVTEEGFRGSSRITPDFTHYAFSSIKLAFTEDGLVEPVGSAYDDNLATGDITLISKTEDGQDIAKDPTSGIAEEFIRIPAISDDGSHILMSTGGPGGTTHLYMRVDHASSYEVSADESGTNQGVKFEGMTSDGSRVFYSTNKQMTADDTDASIDLYAWQAASNSSIRISDSGNLPGNSDACAAAWTSGCNIQVVPITPVENKRFDSAMAIDSGDIYFYSPELLDGARGFPDKRNLYVYRNGDVQHVTTMEPGGGATRINVAPDGAKMAFISSSRLTPYDNEGKAEMYRYDANTRALQCVSCVPSGDAPNFSIEGSQRGLFMTHDGRTFFATRDALVPQDANGIKDVYEFVAGRPQLISTGTGDNAGNAFQPAGLVGVSGDGIDAFFATYETLVPQDENGEQLKFYDARTNGGFQVDKPPAPCEAADECHGADSDPAPPPELGTTANLGDGGTFKSGPRRNKCKKLHGKRKRRCLKKARNAQNRSGRHG